MSAANKTGNVFFNVNGKDVYLENVDPELTLAYYLRNTLGIRGTKLGCEEGVCGSCTVVLAQWNNSLNRAVYRAVNACLVPVFHVHKTFIITIEGVGTMEKIHPIQDRLARGHGAQCGFCTPGFVMSAYALLRNCPKPTIEQINEAVRANLCRCTGYRPILEALYSFTDGGGCCGGKKNGGGCCKDQKEEEDEYKDKLLTFEEFPKYDPTQEIIFPPSLRTYEDNEEMIRLEGPRVQLLIPKTMEQFKSIQGHQVISSGLITRLVAGMKPQQTISKWVSTKYVPEFNENTNSQTDTVTIGAALSIQELADVLVSEMTPDVAKSIEEFFANYSSPQVANFATWSGAIVSGAKSAISVSDLLILFTVLDAKLTVLVEGELKQFKTEEYFNIQPNGVIVNATFDKTEKRRLFLYKAGETGESDSTKFNFAALIGNGTSRIFIGLGGMPKRLEALELHLNSGKGTNVDSMRSTDPTTIKNIAALTKFSEFLTENSVDQKGKIAEKINYLQYFKPSKNECVGRPLANYFSERAVTGDAIYVNDIPAHEAVHLGFVLSTIPHGEILNIDPFEALQLQGVVGFFSVKDIPGSNTPGLSSANTNSPDDTAIFADQKVLSVGQVIGVIAAIDVVLARRAAKLVKVEYKELPALVNFEKARAAKSLLGDVQHYGKSSEEVLCTIGASEKTVEGEVKIGGQEHFYMETQSCLVVPGENEELVVHCSTQATSFTQLMVSAALKIPSHKVIVKTKRLGGAFGGKVSNAAWIASMCGIVACRLHRPVYGFLSRADDLIMTGKRHEVYAKYKVGFTSSGKVNGIHHEAWLNGGWSKDHTEAVTMVMGVMIDSVYNMGDLHFTGHPVKTNSCSNTALRGYGNPQGTLINESVMRKIACELKMIPEDVKRLNFAIEGEKRFMGATIHNDALVECWDYCREWSEFDKRRKAVEEFNKTHSNIKRGIAMSSIRFGLPHPGSTGHGIASVMINLDGFVQLTIGGTEMGQGLNQKMIQVCSEALKRPIDTITIIDTSTDKITNAPETGGSQNADTNGIAVLECCKRIMKGLSPILDENGGDWEKSVREAYMRFIPLQCTEYGVVERQKFGVTEMEPPYNTTGSCTVEMEVDMLTGYNHPVRVDLVMDLGESLNPALDIGQIEGAFLQGYGLVTSEQITFNQNTGVLDQNTASKYKIPRAKDVPKDFRVKLLGVNKATGAQVYSSKGVGEPPLMMSCGAVSSAMMSCIESWRHENGMMEFVETVTPLTAKRILDMTTNIVN